MIGSKLDTCWRGPPLIKLMGHEHWEYAVGGWGEHAMANIHTHTHTVSP